MPFANALAFNVQPSGNPSTAYEEYVNNSSSPVNVKYTEDTGSGKSNETVIETSSPPTTAASETLNTTVPIGVAIASFEYSDSPSTSYCAVTT